MEQLDKVLAQLAEKLGVGSEAFVTWLAGDGLDAYARMNVADALASTIISFIVLAVCIATIRKCVKMVKACVFDDDTYSSIDTEPLIVVACVGLIAAALIGGWTTFVFIDSFRCFIGWSIAPEGMIIQVLVNMLNAM